MTDVLITLVCIGIWVLCALLVLSLVLPHFVHPTANLGVVQGGWGALWLMV